MHSAREARPVRPWPDRSHAFYPDDLAPLQEVLEGLKSRLRLAVIFGGNKATPGSVIYQCHNIRSWKSYEAVAQDIALALRRIGFRHVQLLPDDMLLGDRIRRERIHMAWINSGGVQGYNSAAHTPATLEMLGIPYVGHDPLAVTTLDNKHAFKREAICVGLPTAPFSTWHMARGPFRPDLNSRFQRAFGDYDGPFVVKPVSGRASLNVHFVEDKWALPDAVAEVYRATQNEVLIEKYLRGREYCIAVAGSITAREGRLTRGRDPFTFAALERVLTADEKIFTSMDLRPITNDRFKDLDPRQEAAKLDRMRRLAWEVFREFNLRSLIRLDIRSDENDGLYILEANPKPDLKQPADGITSLISAGLPQAGMGYDDLVLSLLADRLDFLLMHRAETVRHVLDLVGLDAYGAQCARRRGGAPAAPVEPDAATSLSNEAAPPAEEASTLDLLDKATELNLAGLSLMREAAKAGEAVKAFAPSVAEVNSAAAGTENAADEMSRARAAAGTFWFNHPSRR